MKKLELKEFGVQEMNTAEMTKVDGGGLLGDLIGNTVGTVALTAGIIAFNTIAFLQFTLTKLVWFSFKLIKSYLTAVILIKYTGFLSRCYC